MLTGSCHCGAVRYEIHGPLGTVAMCHCGDCRKASGTAYATNASLAREHFALVAGEDALVRYESSPGKRRVFCGRCGSPIFGESDADAGVVRLRLGSVDGDPGVRPVLHGHVAGKAPWDRIEGELAQFAGGDAASRIPRVRIVRADPAGAEARTLIAALDAGLAEVYPKEAMFGLHDEDFGGERLVFLLAREQARALGCGALRSLDGELAEVKRMYVVPEARGRGIARRLLAAIEAIAVGRGHRALRLETGNLQREALALYRSSGFREIPAYGEYVGSAYSVCFEKSLA